MFATVFQTAPTAASITGESRIVQYHVLDVVADNDAWIVSFDDEADNGPLGRMFASVLAWIVRQSPPEFQGRRRCLPTSAMGLALPGWVAPGVGHYPDVYNHFAMQCRFPHALTPRDLIVAVARTLGPQGIEECVRAAVHAIRWASPPHVCVCGADCNPVCSFPPHPRDSYWVFGFGNGSCWCSVMSMPIRGSSGRVRSVFPVQRSLAIPRAVTTPPSCMKRCGVLNERSPVLMQYALLPVCALSGCGAEESKWVGCRLSPCDPHTIHIVFTGHNDRIHRSG